MGKPARTCLECGGWGYKVHLYGEYITPPISHPSEFFLPDKRAYIQWTKAEMPCPQCGVTKKKTARKRAA